ncbi:MAG: radical SAM protein [Candidatus Omnitrophota bacterium]|jgi:MoaA/NifB/PqqE/SkfB family radical SAM enzyme
MEKDFMLILDVSHCNLKCLMCPRGGISGLENSAKGLMDFKLFKRIVNKFVEENIKINFLEFGNWGEPLLNPDLPKMINYARSKPRFMRQGAILNVNTNLTSLPDATVFLKCGVNLVQISISGMTQEIYSRNHKGGNVELVLNNIKKLINVKNNEKLKNVVLKLTFHNYIYNKKEAELAKKFCDKHGLTFIYRRMYVPSVEDNIKFQEEKRKLSKFYSRFIDVEKEMNSMKTMDLKDIKNCRLSKNRVTVNFDGQLYRCCGVFEKINFMGSIFEFKIKDIPNIKSEICVKCAKTPISFRFAV